MTGSDSYEVHIYNTETCNINETVLDKTNLVKKEFPPRGIEVGINREGNHLIFVTCRNCVCIFIIERNITSAV